MQIVGACKFRIFRLMSDQLHIQINVKHVAILPAFLPNFTLTFAVTKLQGIQNELKF